MVGKVRLFLKILFFLVSGTRVRRETLMEMKQNAGNDGGGNSSLRQVRDMNNGRDMARTSFRLLDYMREKDDSVCIRIWGSRRIIDSVRSNFLFILGRSTSPSTRRTFYPSPSTSILMGNFSRKRESGAWESLVQRGHWTPAKGRRIQGEGRFEVRMITHVRTHPL